LFFGLFVRISASEKTAFTKNIKLRTFLTESNDLPLKNKKTADENQQFFY